MGRFEEGCRASVFRLVFLWNAIWEGFVSQVPGGRLVSTFLERSTRENIQLFIDTPVFKVAFNFRWFFCNCFFFFFHPSKICISFSFQRISISTLNLESFERVNLFINIYIYIDFDLLLSNNSANTLRTCKNNWVTLVISKYPKFRSIWIIQEISFLINRYSKGGARVKLKNLFVLNQTNQLIQQAFY